MFDTSDTYESLFAIRHQVNELLGRQYIEDFVTHLHSQYEFYKAPEGKEKPSFLVWLGEQRNYSAIARTSRIHDELYKVRNAVSSIFQKDQFGSRLTEALNHTYGEDNPGKLTVHYVGFTEDQDDSLTFSSELMTFDYDPLWAWGD